MLKRNIGIGCVNNQMLLLVRRYARGGQVTPKADKLRQRRTSYARGGQVTPKENHSPSRLRRTSSMADGRLIDHWAREIVHGCWSGDQQRLESPAYGGRHINRSLCEGNHSGLLVRRPTTEKVEFA